MTLPKIWNHLHDYQKRRIETFLNPEQDPSGSGYQVIQSKIAIGSGGLTGKGFLKGSQKALAFLPMRHPYRTVRQARQSHVRLQVGPHATWPLTTAWPRIYTDSGMVLAAMELLSIPEVAQVLGVSDRRVRALVKGGRLPAIRVGARTHAVMRTELERFADVPRRPGRNCGDGKQGLEPERLGVLEKPWLTTT